MLVCNGVKDGPDKRFMEKKGGRIEFFGGGGGGKGLLAGRTWKVTVSGITNRLNCCVVFIVYTQFNKYGS